MTYEMTGWIDVSVTVRHGLPLTATAGKARMAGIEHPGEITVGELRGHKPRTAGCDYLPAVSVRAAP